MEATLPGDVCDFARHIIDDCGLYSASIFLCDRTGTIPRLSHLFHHNISAEIKDRYERHTIFHDDPFTHPAVKERDDLADYDGVLLAEDERVRSSTTPARYWHFMFEHDIHVVGASTRRLLSGLYATVGYHYQRSAMPRDDGAAARLDALSRRLQDMVGSFMLRDVLRHANGLSGLRTGFFNRLDTPSAPLDRLSPREGEIAALVCQGKQNKEIAYLVGLAEHTVENHLRRIYAKLSIHNRSALVAAMVGTDPARLH